MRIMIGTEFFGMNKVKKYGKEAFPKKYEKILMNEDFFRDFGRQFGTRPSLPYSTSLTHPNRTLTPFMLFKFLIILDLHIF